jgi:hypothetical protein
MKLLILIFSYINAFISRDSSTINNLIKRTNLGFGYAYGNIFTGNILSNSGTGQPLAFILSFFSPCMDCPSPKVHSINSLDLSFGHLIKKNYKIEFEFNYLWQKLYTPVGMKTRDFEVGNIKINNFYLNIFRLGIGYYFHHFINLGLCFYYSKTICKEEKEFSSYYYWKTYRLGKGAGIFLKFEKKIYKKIYTFIKIESGTSKEYKNNSPFKWRNKLIIFLDGIYWGLKFKIGM